MPRRASSPGGIPSELGFYFGQSHHKALVIPTRSQRGNPPGNDLCPICTQPTTDRRFSTLANMPSRHAGYICRSIRLRRKPLSSLRHTASATHPFLRGLTVAHRCSGFYLQNNILPDWIPTFGGRKCQAHSPPRRTAYVKSTLFDHGFG